MILKILKNWLCLLHGNCRKPNEKKESKEKRKEASPADLIKNRGWIHPPFKVFILSRNLSLHYYTGEFARAKFHFAAYRIASHHRAYTISCKRRMKRGSLCLKAGKRLISQIGFPAAARDGRTRSKGWCSRRLFTPWLGRGFMVVVATPNKRQKGGSELLLEGPWATAVPGVIKILFETLLLASLRLSAISSTLLYDVY